MAVYEGVRGYGVDYRDEHGKRRHFIVGTKAAAEAVDAALHSEIAAKRRQLRTFTATADLTVLGLAETWQAGRTCVTAATRKQDASRLAHFIRQHGSLLAVEVTPVMVSTFLELRRDQLSPWSLYQTHRALNFMFAWAKDAAIIPGNPVPRLPRAPRPVTTGFALSKAQEADLLAACTNRARLVCLLMLDAGLDSADISSLRRHQFSLDDAMLVYNGQKTRVHVEVPITERLRAALAVHTAGATSPDARLFRFSQANGVRSALEFTRRAVAFHFRPKDLRHTFISRVAATGCRWRIVQVLAGHVAQTPTEKYDHPSLDELRRVIEAMEKGQRLA